jgi:hypothetical protein
MSNGCICWMMPNHRFAYNLTISFAQSSLTINKNLCKVAGAISLIFNEPVYQTSAWH